MTRETCFVTPLCRWGSQWDFRHINGHWQWLATALINLNGYFAPKKCTEFEIYKFRQSKPEANENIDSFHTKLRTLSENCDFTDKNKEIKSQIIQGCSSTRLRRKALREELSLDDLIKAARALELSESQASQIENNSAETNALGKRRFKPRYP